MFCDSFEMNELCCSWSRRKLAMRVDQKAGGRHPDSRRRGDALCREMFISSKLKLSIFSILIGSTCMEDLLIFRLFLLTTERKHLSN